MPREEPDNFWRRRLEYNVDTFSLAPHDLRVSYWRST